MDMTMELRNALQKGVGVLSPPSGHVYLLDDDGKYLIDDNGAYILVEIT